MLQQAFLYNLCRDNGYSAGKGGKFDQKEKKRHLLPSLWYFIEDNFSFYPSILPSRYGYISEAWEHIEKIPFF